MGLLIARGIASTISGLITDVYGVAQHADEIASSPMVLALSLFIGISTSLVAALVPAAQAARIDPVQAVQKGKYQVLSVGESRIRAGLSLLLGAISVGCLKLKSSSAPGLR